MRGYFAIGVEGISKAMNLGNLFRSAHALPASSVFTVDAPCSRSRATSDTSDVPSEAIDAAAPGAIVMDDRLVSFARSARRLLISRGQPGPRAEHVGGASKVERRRLGADAGV